MSSNRHGARRGQPVLAWCALAVLMVLLIAGCALPGGGASTHNDVNRCAAVLPLARDVVGGQGMLALVRPVNRAQADTITRQVGVTPPPRPRPSRAGTPQPGPKACLVAYHGNYHADVIPQALPPGASGQYALIVLWVRHPSVDRILISDTLPAAAHGPWWHF